MNMAKIAWKTSVRVSVPSSWIHQQLP